MTRLIVWLAVLALAGAGTGYALFSFVLGGTPKIAVMNGVRRIPTTYLLDRTVLFGYF